MAVLGKRGIQARGPLNLLRTLLTAAVETGALEAMPNLLDNDACAGSGGPRRMLGTGRVLATLQASSAQPTADLE